MGARIRGGMLDRSIPPRETVYPIPGQKRILADKVEWSAWTCAPGAAPYFPFQTVAYFFLYLRSVSVSINASPVSFTFSSFTSSKSFFNATLMS